MRYRLLVLIILPVALGAFLGSCRTATVRPSTTGTPQAAPDDFLRSDTPTVSSREEVADFAKVDADPYYVGPGDVMRLRSGNNEFPEEELKVTPDGKINVSNIGELSVARMEVSTIQREINDRLKKFYANVECKLVLLTANNRKISLLGAVKAPGIFPLDNEMTLIDAIAKAGGFETGDLGSSLAKQKYYCRIIRDNGKTVWIDLKAILFQNASVNNVRLKNNDILYVIRQ